MFNKIGQFKGIYLYFVAFFLLAISNLSLAATITPDGNCTLQNCVRYVLTTDDGLKIRVFEWKKSNGQLNSNAPAVVFLNGFPHSQLEWLPVTQSRLANKYRLITFNLRGHGLSDKPTDSASYSNGTFAGDIQNIITLLNLRKVVLVSHSHGGTTLMDYIINKGTASLKGIVLASAFTKLNLADANTSAQVFTPDALVLAPRLLNDQDEGDYLDAGKTFVAFSSQTPLPKVSVDILAMDMIVTAPVRQAIFLPPRNVSNAALSNLEIPSLVIHGEKDHLINVSHAIENYRLLGRKSQLIIYRGIGHLPQYENTDTFNHDLEEFLEKVN